MGHYLTEAESKAEAAKVAALTEQVEELREALLGVPRWEENSARYKCLGCGGEVPLSYDINAFDISHPHDCWVGKIERTLREPVSDGE